MANLFKIYDDLQMEPIPVLQRYAQGANPEVPPWAATAVLNAKMARQQRAQLAQGAAQGPQPSVAEQVNQKAATLGLMGLRQQQAAQQGAPEAAPQAQPQAPVMAARGGLMAARTNPDMFNFSGGGIIAFRKGGDKGEREEDDKEVYPGMIPTEGGTVLPKTTGLEGMSLGDLLSVLGNKAKDYFSPEREKANAAAMYAGRTTPPPVDQSMQNARDVLLAREAAPKAAPAAFPYEGPTRTNVPPTAAAQPAVVPAGAPQVAKSAPAGPESEVEKIAMDLIRNREMVNKPTMEDFRKQREESRKAYGITELPAAAAERGLAAIEARRAKEDAAREEMIKGRGLDNLITTLTSVGGSRLGSGLARGARAALEAEAGQRAEDVAHTKMRDEQAMKVAEIRRLNAAAQLALADGDVDKYNKLLSEAEDAQRSLDKSRLTAATSMANTEESARTRRQIAADAAAGRAQSAAATQQARQDLQAEKREAGFRELALKLATASAQKDMALPQNFAKYRGMSVEQVAAEMYPSFLRQLMEGKISPSPTDGAGRGKVIDWNQIGKK